MPQLLVPSRYLDGSWIHVLLGLIILLAGLGVFTGAVWARTVEAHGRDVVAYPPS